MNLSTRFVEKKVWDMQAEQAHVEAFGDLGIEHYLNYKFVVLVENEDKQQMAYTMIKETDKESAYITFGGTFKPYRSGGSGYACFKEIVSSLLMRYKRVGFACRTKNHPMIKLGLNEQFEIVGMRMFYGFPYLEFLKERG